MKQIFRIFIRHESEAQPAYIKMESEKSSEEILNEIRSAMAGSGPSLWGCTDVKNQSWLFRADKIYTVCVYPPEVIQPEAAEEGERIDIATS